MNNWTITNKLVAIARAAQRGTTLRHSWTISTFTRFPRFFRLATRRQKRLLRRLSNRILRRTFMKPFVLFLRIFLCSLCVFCALFSGTLRFFSVSFSSRPPFEELGTQMRLCYKLWHLSLILSTVHKTELVAKEAPLLTQERQYSYGHQTSSFVSCSVP